MTIGTGPDIEQFNREKENNIRRQDKKEKEMDNWYANLTDKGKLEIINYVWDDASLATKIDIFEIVSNMKGMMEERREN